MTGTALEGVKAGLDVDAVAVGFLLREGLGDLDWG